MTDNYWGRVVIAGLSVLASWVILEYSVLVLMMMLGLAFVFPIVIALALELLHKLFSQKSTQQVNPCERELNLYKQVAYKLENSSPLQFSDRFKERNK